MKDSQHTINRSATRFFSGTLLSRISGFLRDTVMAFCFGTQPAVAAFMVAFRLAHLLRRIFGEGAMQSALIPHFESIRKQDSASAYQFFRDLKASLLVTLFAVILLGALLCFPLAVWGVQSAFLTLLMLPSLLFISLFGVNQAILQCEKSYFIGSFSPVIANGVWIAAALLFFQLESDRAMIYLSLSVVLGSIGQWILTEIRLKKYSPSKREAPSFFSSSVKEMFPTFFLAITGVAAAQVNAAADALFARVASEEGPAYLWYAIRLQQAPLALIGIAISSSLLPPLSRSASLHDWEGFSRFLGEGMRKIVGVMIPISLFFILMGMPIVALAFGRGNFGVEAISYTSRSLWAYSLGLIPMALIVVIAPAFYACKNYRSPAIGAFLTMGINLALNSLFIFKMGMGAVSVALATAVSSWVNLFYLLKVVPNAVSVELSLSEIAAKVVKTVVGGAVVIGFDQLLFGGGATAFLLAGELVAVPRFEVLCAQLLLSGAVFSLLFRGR